MRWLTGESGESIVGLCQSDSLSTTLTAISRITTSQILNSLPHSITNAFTLGAKKDKTGGGNPATSAASSSASMPTTGISRKKDTHCTEGAESVISQLLSWISAEENWLDFRNIHSTVKPIALMRWLCRLVTPPGGIVLEPFAGSGTTCIAAVQEGFRYLACEMNPEYVAIAEARIKAARNDTALFADCE